MAKEPGGRAFQDVDTADDPDYWVNYLDQASQSPHVQAGRRTTIDALALHPGDAVLDVGCGTGDVLFDLAAVVGPSGRAVGVDMSSVMLSQTGRRAQEERLRVTLATADAAALPFPDATFHGGRIERVLIHVESPEAVLREMVRVVKPRGGVATFDPVHGTMFIVLPDVEVARKIRAWTEDRAVRNPRVAIDAAALLRRLGLVDVSVTPIPTFRIGTPPVYLQEQHRRNTQLAAEAGYITAQEEAAHLAVVDEVIASDSWLQMGFMLVTSGRKP